MAVMSQEGSPLTGGGYDPLPPPGVMEAVGVAPEGAQLIASGLSTEVVETILQSRAPSTKKLYGLKWRITSWCGDRQLDPVNCPIGTVLEFLQARFSAGLTHSTLRVYMAATAAYHAPMGGQSVGKDPLITRFLRGVMRLRPRVRSRVPPWDLTVVLEALCKPPFEPIEEVSERLLTLKTVLLLAISSLKRVGDLQALSVAPSFLDLRPAWPKLFCTLVRGTSLRSPPLYHDLLYSRHFVLLPSGSPTRRGLIVCVKCEHWTYTSTELPCGERRTNCWYATVPLKRVFQLLSRSLVGG